MLALIGHRICQGKSIMACRIIDRNGLPWILMHFLHQLLQRPFVPFQEPAQPHHKIIIAFTQMPEFRLVFLLVNMSGIKILT